MNEHIKQVLIWRSDLRNTQGQKVRSGKVAAQLAHASMKVFFDNIEYCDNGEMKIVNMTPEAEQWIGGLFTKICLAASSEQELLDIYNAARNKGILCSLVQDAGLTEFGGVPTYTAVAIGPAKSYDIDQITRHLSLL